MLKAAQNTNPFYLNDEGALRDDIRAIKAGFLVLLPVLDRAGRAIIYARSHIGYGFPTDQVSFTFTLISIQYLQLLLIHLSQKLRVWWYLCHIACENPTARKNGFIILGNVREYRIIHYDSRYTSGEREFP